MTKTLVALVSFCATITAQVTTQPQPPAITSSNPVIQWNRNLLAILRTPGVQPGTIQPTRSFAMMHAAIYNAVNAIDGTHQSYNFQAPVVTPGASQEAAADQAAHDVLVALYPQLTALLDTELQQSFALLSDGPQKEDGIAIGQSAAAQIVALRSNDGSAATPPSYVFGTAPGDFQSTPPNFPKPQFTHWSQVTPFVLARADQFRPGPPPALTSDTYTSDFNEIESVGMLNSSSPQLTQPQQVSGIFWNGAIQNYWNEITQSAASAKNLSTADSARLFALLNFSLADTVIAFYDAKYTYNFWRPITAIRAADTDGNPNTAPNPTWLPEVITTTPDPSYPGAHAAISYAAATVLSSFFGTDQATFNVTSEVFAGFLRSFTTFSAAAQEASLSRIYAGVHFRSDETAGQQLGSGVASFVTTNVLASVSH